MCLPGATYFIRNIPFRAVEKGEAWRPVKERESSRDGHFGRPMYIVSDRF